MLKKNLIVGGNGQDAYFLSKLLLKKKEKVVSIINKKINREIKGVKYVKLDILSQEKVSLFLKKFKLLNIYFLASYNPSVRDTYDETLLNKNIQINVLGLTNFLESIYQSQKRHKLFYASSSHIFADTKNKIQKETTEPKFNSIYALAKYLGKEVCNFYRDKRNVICSTGIMYSHVSYLSKKNFLINEMISQMKSNKNIIKVLNSQSKVDLLSANDAVEAMYKIMQSKKPDNFIVSSKKLISVKDIFLELKKKTNKNLKLIDLKKKIINKNNSLKGDNSKIKRKCKWKPKDSLGKIIEEFLNKS
tara:strand:+ start:2986 stop:3897 length:912 start_codon:yes stop_codon:yes gene_type:complete